MFIKQVAGIASLALGSVAHSYFHELSNNILPQLAHGPLYSKYFSYIESATITPEPPALATSAAGLIPSVDNHNAFDDTANIAADILRGVRQIIFNTFGATNVAVAGSNNMPPPPPLEPEEPEQPLHIPYVDDSDGYEPLANTTSEIEKIPDWNTLDRFTPEIMVELNRVQSLAVSPSKRRAAFTFYKYTIDGDQEASNIRFIDIAEPANVRNATEFVIDGSDDEPVWLDESNIAFTAKRNNASESNIYIVNVDTGNQYQLTNFSTSVSGLIYSPATNVVAFTASVFQGLGLEETAKTLASISSAPAHGKVYDTLFVRHWDTWLDGTKSQLFALPLGKRNGMYEAIADPQNLVSSYPGSWGLEPYDYSFSKDGQRIVFSANIPGRDEAWSTRANIFTVSVGGDGQAQPLSLNPQAIGGCSSPTFSPDGAYIAWLQMPRPNNGNDQNQVILYSTANAETKRLVSQWSLSPDSIQFTESGQHLLIVVEEEGDTRLYRLDVETGNLEQLTTDGTVQTPLEGADGSILYMHNTAQFPNEIAKLTISDSGTNTDIISTFNTEVLSMVWMSPPTRFYFTGALGDRVQGVLYRPYGFNMTETYPLAFIIHGGPYGSSGNHWSWRWNQNTFANQGFVVVEINFHGSTGFGQAFADAVRFQWGGYPFEDLMKGLNYVTRTYAFIDTSRMAALGASYGGYMITWMLGHTTPFKAYVCHDGEFSSYSTFFSTDEIGFDEHESGLPWDVDGMVTYERWDPRRYVGRWNTPTLVIHGEKDYRLPVTEGISIFAALQRRGVPSRFLYFPDENHWVLRPANSLQWHAVVLDWIAMYTNTKLVSNSDQGPVDFEAQEGSQSETSEETDQSSTVEVIDDEARVLPITTGELSSGSDIDSAIEPTPVADHESDEAYNSEAVDELVVAELSATDSKERPGAMESGSDSENWSLDGTQTDYEVEDAELASETVSTSNGDTQSVDADTDSVDSLEVHELSSSNDSTDDGVPDPEAVIAGSTTGEATADQVSDSLAAGVDLIGEGITSSEPATDSILLNLVPKSSPESIAKETPSVGDISDIYIQTTVPEIVSATMNPVAG